ncbi:MAG: hypothetical protein A2X86_14925 [Bdellovibrionales bacterium GWA2_49_15]|nr:MAG: hypothetical protein A2X86_14925 [Bdellovibrionales bacterium GWA2_49_15]HAZ13364.1 hypothetical protein [Bdellovibrionales bacterium]
MQKMILSFVLFLFVMATNATTLKPIKTVKDAKLALFDKVTVQICAGKEDIVSSNYKFFDLTVRPNEQITDAYLRAVKLALHRDYPMTGDDGGYSLTILDASITVNQLNRMIPSSFYENDSYPRKVLKKLNTALIASAKNKNLRVFIGRGSGYNTSAEIIVVLDVKNKEFIYLLESNFGREY